MLVIFDLSEVCVQGLSGFHERISEITGRSVESVKSVVNDRVKLVELFEGKISEEKYWDFVIEKLKISMSKEMLKKMVRENFDDKQYVETHKIIADLKSKKIPLFLLSDHAKEWADYLFSKYEFLKLFDKTYFSYDLGVTKLSVESFKKVLFDLDTDGTNVLFIDDSEGNTIMAEKAGIKYTEVFIAPSSLRKVLIDKYSLM